MANICFNISLGAIKQYYANVDLGTPANSRIIVVPIETTGIEADATIRDHNDLGALLAASNNEQTTMGRKTLTAADVTITVNDGTELVDVDVSDVTWVGATGNAISALLFCYDNDNAAGTDADIIPLTKHDFVVTPDGSDIVAQIAAAGIFRAS